jgi:seryl-tRNA synthetase
MCAGALPTALLAHRHARLVDTLTDAREAAQRQSGQRGVAARKHLVQLEKQLANFAIGETEEPDCEAAVQVHFPAVASMG